MKRTLQFSAPAGAERFCGRCSMSGYSAGQLAMDLANRLHGNVLHGAASTVVVAPISAHLSDLTGAGCGKTLSPDDKIARKWSARYRISLETQWSC